MGYSQDANGNISGGGFKFDGSNLSSNPGYQFNLLQGLNGVNASSAARGLGVSGANIKGAESYAEGLGNQYYNDYYNQALNTYDTNVNKLASLVNMGQNSAAQTAQLGSSAQSSANNYLTSGAAAQAAGTVGSANAINSGISGALNYYGNNQLVNAIYANNANNSAGANSFISNPAYTQNPFGNF